MNRNGSTVRIREKRPILPVEGTHDDPIGQARDFGQTAISTTSPSTASAMSSSTGSS